jgi:hypothetical protein
MRKSDWRAAPKDNLAERAAIAEAKWLKENGLRKRGRSDIVKRKKRSPGYWARRRMRAVTP